MGSPYFPGGYWLAGADGAVYSCGDAPFFGSLKTLGVTPNRPIVGIASTPDDGGYWLVASDGGIFAFGDARFYGSMGGTSLNSPIVGIGSAAGGYYGAGSGYYEVASDGGIFAFGSATFQGSMGGRHLNAPMVGMLSYGFEYYTVASDGGIFSFGPTVPFVGSMGGQHLNRPVVGMADGFGGAGGGYYEVASDGGIFAFSTPFLGSLGCLTLNRPIVGMISFTGSGTLSNGTACGSTGTETNDGYDLVASDGGVFSFGRAPFAGSLGGLGVNDIVGIAQY